MRKIRRLVPAFVSRWYDSRLAVVFESVFIGLVTGLVIVFFRYTLSRADDLRRHIYDSLAGLPGTYLLLWAAVLAVIGLFLGMAAKYRPMIKGSGIPQIEGVLDRKMVLHWKSELPLKIVTGILGIGAGLSLGREGPSIQIGAYVGRGVLSVLHRDRRERKVLITAASAAGLAAAFNAPLAGVLFVLEELRAGFSPLFLACVMGAAMTADATTAYFFGAGLVFDFSEAAVLPLNLMYWVAFLGVVCGLLGAFFKNCLYFFLNLYDRLGVPQVLRPVFPLLFSIPLGFFLFDATGGGHGLIEALSAGHHDLRLICVLFVVKVLFTALSYGSGTSGGIFLPLLACGALAGDGLGEILGSLGIIGEAESLNFLILGMAAFFAGVVNAPVTGIILILEMSGNFNHLGNLVLVSLSAYVTSELLGSRPVYAVLLERLLRRPVSRPAAETVPAG
jgi:H+/Cl- antiporter ClcA